jgi:hypothetical protein
LIEAPILAYSDVLRVMFELTKTSVTKMRITSIFQVSLVAQLVQSMTGISAMQVLLMLQEELYQFHRAKLWGARLC